MRKYEGKYIIRLTTGSVYQNLTEEEYNDFRQELADTDCMFFLDPDSGPEDKSNIEFDLNTRTWFVVE